MIQLDQVLPELERAVHERVESKLLASMEPGDLRDIIYKLVEQRRSAAIDPQHQFAELVANASERHADLVEAREYSIAVRTELLRRLVETIRPAIGALLGPITVETQHHRDGHDERKDHPLLLGYELFDGLKKTVVGSTQGRDGQSTQILAVSGRSWWLVALPGERLSECVSVRYASATHGGKLDEHGDGVSSMDLELVTAVQAAAQIRDQQFEKILKIIRHRLLSLVGPRVTKATDSIWRVANVLDSALAAMKSTNDDTGEPKDKTG